MRHEEPPPRPPPADLVGYSALSALVSGIPQEGIELMIELSGKALKRVLGTWLPDRTPPDRHPLQLEYAPHDSMATVLPDGTEILPPGSRITAVRVDTPDLDSDKRLDALVRELKPTLPPRNRSDIVGRPR